MNYRLFSKKIAKKCNAVLFMLLLLTQITLGVYFAAPVRAADAGASYIRCDRMKAGTAPGSCLVVFTTSSTNFTEAFIKLTLDSEWVSTTNFSSTAADYTVSTSGLPGGVTAMPGVTTGSDVTSQTITFPVTALANSTTYGFFITGGLTLNPAASTTITHVLFTRDTGDTSTGDTQNLAVPTISDDQIIITASVAPTFTFVFANNAQNLGTLSSGSVISGTGTGITITTNAPGGWYAWMKNAGAGLVSAAASKTIAASGTVDGSPTAISSGSEGYVVDVDLTTDAGSGGAVTIAAEYNGLTTSAGGTPDSTAYQQIASANGTANGDVITIIPRAAISGVTPAASDYTDTLTVVGAAVF